ncbi:MAG: hypothetical protein PSV16_07210 [Flavobacterium sp.]|nr:hypothetical protein [Flavobacterium sp.]
MNTYENVYNQFEKGFLGSCSLGILVQSCMGGVTAMAILSNGTGVLQMVQLFLVVSVCLAFNGSVISVQPHKMVFNLLVLGLTVCGVLSVLNYFL